MASLLCCIGVASVERQPGEELKMAWVPTDQGDGIRREVDDDKRDPHDSGTARERRWAKRDPSGHKRHFSRSVHAGEMSWRATSSKVAKI